MNHLEQAIRASIKAIKLREAAIHWVNYSPDLRSGSYRDHEGERLWVALAEAAVTYSGTASAELHRLRRITKLVAELVVACEHRRDEDADACVLQLRPLLEKQGVLNKTESPASNRT